jgi:hypothetical protein
MHNVLSLRLLEAWDVSQPMRPQFDENAVFPRSIWARFGRIRIVNEECRLFPAARLS